MEHELNANWDGAKGKNAARVNFALNEYAIPSFGVINFPWIKKSMNKYMVKCFILVCSYV